MAFSRPAPMHCLAAALLLAGAGASAQPSAAAPAASAPAPHEAPLVQTNPRPRVPEPKVEHLVTEDSQVRIEETRVRGVTTRIVVHSKIPGMGSYEIQPRQPGVDPAHDPAAGMRLFQFKLGS